MPRHDHQLRRPLQLVWVGKRPLPHRREAELRVESRELRSEIDDLDFLLGATVLASPGVDRRQQRPGMPSPLLGGVDRQHAKPAPAIPDGHMDGGREPAGRSLQDQEGRAWRRKACRHLASGGPVTVDEEILDPIGRVDDANNLGDAGGSGEAWLHARN